MIAPAIAAGCASVLKPAALTPLTSLLFAKVLQEVGVPAGVINVIPTASSGAVTGPIIKDARLRKLSFTGSTPVGRRLIADSAERVLRVSMELGGNAPFLVFEDADIDKAVAGAMLAKLRNMGEACTAANRFIVHESVADEFAAKFAEKAAAIKQGDPRDENTDIGPQIHQKHFDRVKGFVDRAKEDGANIVWGGEPNADLGGLFFKPTLVKNPAPGSEIVSAEIFGPVLCMQTFSSDEQALEMANGTEFGLAAVVVSGDREHAEKVTKNLVAGTIWVNCFFVRDLRAPFGGSKKSGIGRDGGTWSFDFYADVKNTVFSPNGWKE